MTAQLIDGLVLANQLKTAIAQKTAHYYDQHHLKPGLAVVLVGNNPASEVYVRNKIKACEQVGFISCFIQLEESTSQENLLNQIKKLNQDPAIHGILVQLPLPKHLDSHQVIEYIDADKDVDGFHVSNAGLLMTGTPLFIPCTPYGVMKMLEQTGVQIEGAEAVVVGASNIVGKPQALLLLQQGATVTLCHSKTKNLASHCKRADILIVAVGKPNLITADMVKTGAVVIDVGINRLENGQLCGDVHFDTVKQVAGYISPVPGGVGPMTITMLLHNTLHAFKKTLALP